MSLRDPDARRALRNVLLCALLLILVVLVWRLADMLAGDVLSLREIARDSLIIIGLFVLGVITENVGRVSVDIASVKASMGCDDDKGAGDAQ